MQFHQKTAELYIPDGASIEAALARTTHLAVSAHQDDIEIMAAQPILACYQQPDRGFTGVVMADGRGSPRAGMYQNYSDDEMRQVRLLEQKRAAMVGGYTALALLDYPSRALKDGRNQDSVEDLVAIFEAARPQMVYTHNLADKHDTHVAVALKVIAAIRRLPEAARPDKLYGCEVWRGLDWALDSEKVVFDLTEHQNLQEALLGVYDSQIAGGKRYDLAAMGRRRANATFFESHGLDQAEGLSYALDLTPLVQNPDLSPADYIQGYIQRFTEDVCERLRKVG